MNRRKRARIGFAALGAAVCACSILAYGWEGKGESLSGEGSGKVYVPEFLSCSLPCDSVNLICSNGTEIFAVGETGEEREITQGEDTYITYEYRTGIFRISPDGGLAEELEQYRPSWERSNEEGSLTMAGLAADGEGTLWVTEQVNRNLYELPEGFDGTADEKWEYLTGVESSYVLRKLDSQGRETERIETGNLEEKTGLDVINSVLPGQDGCIYVLGGSSLLVLDRNLEPRLTLEDEDLQGDMVLCGDGRVAVTSLDNEDNRVLKLADGPGGKWGKEYVLPSNAYTVYPGRGEFLFLYENGDSLYAMRKQGQEAEKLLSWSGVDINRDYVLSFCILEDGRIAALNQSEDGGLELVLLTRREQETLAEKTVLTYATLQLGYQDRMRIIRFNKRSAKYRVEIRDYSEWNTEGSPQEGLTRLNADILAGNIPDILDMEGLPLRQYARKGILEDLWPYIEKDKDLGREALMERVLQAAETDGHLYRIFGSFSINTVVGAKRTVGDSKSWGLKELLAARETMGSDCQIFGQNDTKQDILRRILAQNMGSYVNWTKGECSFDSESFLSVLEFCDTFPLRQQAQGEEYESEFNRIAQGRQMLLELNVSDFDYIQLLEGLFQGEVTYVGYPTEGEGVGSSFEISAGTAMTSQCRDKEGAWEFLREILLPQSRENEFFYPGSFPVNKEDFTVMVNRAMEKEWLLDEDGEKALDGSGQPIEVSKGGWMIDGMEISIYAMKQEQLDRFLDLYQSIDTVSGSDDTVTGIVEEETELFFQGDKTAEQAAEIIQNRVSLYVNEQK